MLVVMIAFVVPAAPIHATSCEEFEDVIEREIRDSSSVIMAEAIMVKDYGALERTLVAVDEVLYGTQENLLWVDTTNDYDSCGPGLVPLDTPVVLIITPANPFSGMPVRYRVSAIVKEGSDKYELMMETIEKVKKQPSYTIERHTNTTTKPAYERKVEDRQYLLRSSIESLLRDATILLDEYRAWEART